MRKKLKAKKPDYSFRAFITLVGAAWLVTWLVLAASMVHEPNPCNSDTYGWNPVAGVFFIISISGTLGFAIAAAWSDEL